MCTTEMMPNASYQEWSRVCPLRLIMWRKIDNVNLFFFFKGDILHMYWTTVCIKNGHDSIWAQKHFPINYCVGTINQCIQVLWITCLIQLVLIYTSFQRAQRKHKLKFYFPHSSSPSSPIYGQALNNQSDSFRWLFKALFETNFRQNFYFSWVFSMDFKEWNSVLIHSQSFLLLLLLFWFLMK